MKRRPGFIFLTAAVISVLLGPLLRAGEEVVRSPSGRALVCFYREVAFEGNLFKYRLRDGGAPIGSLAAESCLFYEAKPGLHTFRIGLLRGGSVDLQVQRNHIYYLRCDPAPEVFYARPQLTQVPVVEGASVVVTLRREPDAR